MVSIRMLLGGQQRGGGRGGVEAYLLLAATGSGAWYEDWCLHPPQANSGSWQQQQLRCEGRWQLLLLKTHTSKLVMAFSVALYFLRTLFIYLFKRERLFHFVHMFSLICTQMHWISLFQNVKKEVCKTLRRFVQFSGFYAVSDRAGLK